MIAQRFVFTSGFLTERNTGCISEGNKFLVGTKIKRGLVILVRNAGQDKQQAGEPAARFQSITVMEQSTTQRY